MKNKAFNVVLKISVLTSIFFVIINYFGYLINAQENNAVEMNSANKEKFISNDISIVGSVGVAITTNVGTRYKQRQEIPVSIYKDVIDVGYILSNQNVAKDKIITLHMMALNEYLNVLKTDVKSLLSSSNDRSFALKSFIAQLEYRYKVGTQNSKTLNMQKQELVKIYNSSNTKIETLKTQIGSDFGNFNSNETLTNLDNYLKLKQENTNARTYLVFIDKFLANYEILNNYNKKILDTLINNQEILIKNSQVVIPNTGGDLLKELKILYTEEEWKKYNQ